MKQKGTRRYSNPGFITISSEIKYNYMWMVIEDTGEWIMYPPFLAQLGVYYVLSV